MATIIPTTIARPTMHKATGMSFGDLDIGRSSASATAENSRHPDVT